MSAQLSAAAERLAPPRHVAIVMDGNGRWAKKRFLPRFFGHKQGVDALVKVVQAPADRGVGFLTVFAFSSENWKRPEEEVSGLMSLLLVAVAKHLTKLCADGVRIRIAGDLENVSPKIRDALLDAQAKTAANSRLTLTVAFNYGGRWDLLQSVSRMVQRFPDQHDGFTEEQLARAIRIDASQIAPQWATPSARPIRVCGCWCASAVKPRSS